MELPANTAAASIEQKDSLAVAMAMEAKAIEAKQAVMAKLKASAPVAISGREIAPARI